MNFKDDEKIVLIMTQERLFKLIYDRKRNLKIDVLLIDEAHNIFERGSRAFLLAKTIYLLKNRNQELIIKYFSPIIDSSNNLKLKNDTNYNLEQLKINPKMKVEKYYYADFFIKKEYIYDQFLNEFYCCGGLNYIDKYEYIIQNASSKNLIYLNRPKHIKDELLKMEKYLPNNTNDSIEKICKTLEDYVGKDYDLIDYIRKGIVYHFGAMPDNVRNYVEKCVKEEENLKYIFCTSTLLEGVNMPFNKLFILDLKKGRSNLTYHHLKNLIGRVNRYNNIFDLKNKSLDGLISKVYFIKERNENSSFVDFIKNNGGFDAFNFGLVVPYTDSGRNVSYYTDISVKGEFIDYLGNKQYYNERSGICLQQSDFTLKRNSKFEEFIYSITGEFIDYIQF